MGYNTCMEQAPEMREMPPVSSPFPALEGVIDGMVSCERDPDDCGDLEREWTAAYAAALASAKAGDREHLLGLANFADYHAGLLGTLGLTETSLAKFLTGERDRLRAAHAEFLEA